MDTFALKFNPFPVESSFCFKAYQFSRSVACPEDINRLDTPPQNNSVNFRTTVDILAESNIDDGLRARPTSDPLALSVLSTVYIRTYRIIQY